MADPIVIAHVRSGLGERLCKAPDAPLSVDFDVEVAARGRWGNGTSVVRCRSCDDALRHVRGLSPSTSDARVGVTVAAS